MFLHRVPPAPRPILSLSKPPPERSAAVRMPPARGPFRSTEQAWFWTIAMLQPTAAPLGPAEIRASRLDVILKCLDQLYRRRRIDLMHARILRIWGLRGRGPDPRRPGERSDARIWREAIDRLDWPLRMKGVVQSIDRN